MNEKLETVLQLALQSSEEERERTENLNVGFDKEQNTWELIVKYNGSLEELTGFGVQVEYLIAGYAILTVPENLVEFVAGREEIEYVEKPKRYYYAQIGPREGSCLSQVTLREPFLNGEGVLLAVLDSGIEYRLSDFRKPNGETRIRALWDQSITCENDCGNPPENFRVGVEFTEEQINDALQMENSVEQFAAIPSRDVSGHGTAVTGIAAASLRQDGGYVGVAPLADLLVVKLGTPQKLGFPRTTEIMRGVTYALQKATEWNQPMVINLSFGNNYGPHDGSSLLERFLDNAAEIGRTLICVGSGNEGNEGGHFAGDIQENQRVELAIGEYEQSLSVQIWKQYADQYGIRIISPGGETAEIPIGTLGEKFVLTLEQTQILVFLGEPAPYSAVQEIYLEFVQSGRPYINSGVWTFLLEPIRVVTGQYSFYLSGSAVLNAQTGFFESTPEVTLTIPSTAQKVLTVGAYDSTYDAYADFSGRGFVDEIRERKVVTVGRTKPDIVAPGVGILAPDVYGGYQSVTGTSFATPIVSGSAALLMEWGILRGNDPFLYGEKVKAYFRKGARPLRGEQNYPNDRVGWGALCVRDSLP